MNSIVEDFRYVIRQLRKNAGFTALAVITLALGVGANTAVFSTVNALLLHPHLFSDIDRLVRVAGVVEDVKQNWWDPQPRPTVYLPYQQAPQRVMNVVIRTFAEPATAISSVREVVHKLDPQVALMDVHDMNGVIADALSPVRIIAILMTVFGAIALALSALGIYGVLAQSVAQRTREFGIRMALGSSRGDVLKAVIVQALRLSAIGLAISLPISVALTHLMSSWVFGIVGLNVSIFAGFATLLVLSAVTAAYLPARRAAKADPMAALRQRVRN